MTLQASYAKALRESVQNGKVSEKDAISNLKAALVRRGHQKLIPQIIAEYERILVREERSRKYKEVTPEKERTRVLYELYRKLIRTSLRDAIK
jgi:hypothetical protein